MIRRVKRTVLVVEDDPLQLIDSIDKVMRAGYIACSASSAEDGILKLKDHRIDAILTDIVLPGMSGLRSIAEYAKRTSAPVLVMTSDLAAGIESDSLQLGARCCLRKPLDFSRLRRELAEALSHI